MAIRAIWGVYFFGDLTLTVILKISYRIIFFKVIKILLNFKGQLTSVNFILSFQKHSNFNYYKPYMLKMLKF